MSMAMVVVVLPRPTAGGQLDKRKLLERGDECEQSQQRQRRHEDGKCDRAEASEDAGAVNHRRLVVLVRDRLQAGEDHEPEEGETLPRSHQNDDDEGEVGLVNPEDVVVDAEQRRRQAVDDAEVRVQHDEKCEHYRDIGDRPRDTK